MKDDGLDLSGIFIAKVINNNDEKKRERVKVNIIGVHKISDDIGIWAENGVSIPFFSGYIPRVNDFVYVMFLKSSNSIYDPERAVYLGVVKYNNGE